MPSGLTIGIAGSGGDGVVLLGELLAKASARAGWHTMLQKSFGPQIRGGESSVRIRVSPEPISWPGDEVDALLLFSWESLTRFKSELSLAAEATIIVDSNDSTPVEQAPVPGRYHSRIVQVPFDDLALRHGKTKQAKNMVMAGVVCEYFGWPADGLEAYILDRFSRQGQRVVESNLGAVIAGREYARQFLAGAQAACLAFPIGRPLHFMSGDEAFGLGVVHAGCRFMAGYPISPASELLEWLARELPSLGGQCIQAEDEIAAACLAIGASYGGAKAMTATSGPGLTLMQEAICFATAAELPLLVCDVQRCGPSTGIPTRTEQGDLLAAIHGGHGDEQRCVLAAVDVEDCYELAHQGFEIAERFQMPVIVLLDQYLGQNHQSIDSPNWRIVDGASSLPPKEGAWRLVAGQLGHNSTLECTLPYSRYDISRADGVSPMASPGTPGGEHLAAGIEQSPDGAIGSGQANHQLMSAKRAAKLSAAGRQFELVAHWSDPGKRNESSGGAGSRLGILTWGSSWGVCIEAAKALEARGRHTAVMAVRMLNPLPMELLLNWLRMNDWTLMVEANFSGQLDQHLRSQISEPVLLDRLRSFHRAGGTPIGLAEILNWINELGLK